MRHTSLFTDLYHEVLGDNEKQSECETQKEEDRYRKRWIIKLLIKLKNSVTHQPFDGYAISIIAVLGRKKNVHPKPAPCTPGYQNKKIFLIVEIEK